MKKQSIEVRISSSDIALYSGDGSIEAYVRSRLRGAGIPITEDGIERGILTKYHIPNYLDEVMYEWTDEA